MPYTISFIQKDKPSTLQQTSTHNAPHEKPIQQKRPAQNADLIKYVVIVSQ